ncbi:conserved hypothetical protein [Candidatus Accumulibacter aalborgensis]|uniref:DUF1640 domain-containing protein n=1 Tax=Candidatus Accumulibacter aalborgensis TaxID=1860102 RepID=A0A1A8XHC0_9PROT|nr:hypothetical protein [Candidatus Accumulibacter aalborgensis]SBT04091.1 conserved hypothetical protein [Candidatus Accumulibacter aalborgensis]
MSAITFDTLKFAERLEKAGMSRELASALAEAQKDSLAEVMEAQMATKGDVAALEKPLRLDLERVERKLIEHDGKFALLQWMIGIVIALALANFAQQFF